MKFFFGVNFKNYMLIFQKVAMSIDSRLEYRSICRLLSGTRDFTSRFITNNSLSIFMALSPTVTRFWITIP